MQLTRERLRDGLAWRAEMLYERLPRQLRVWLRNQRLNLEIRRGRTAYDRTRLMHTFRESLRILRERDAAAPIGDYLEFGVYHGTSLSCMHAVRRELRLEGTMRLFGFDSFEGLPPSAAGEDDAEWWPGEFKSSTGLTRRNLRRWGIADDEVVLVKGWFNESLTDATCAQHGIEHASVLMVDCDLYSSTCDVLRFSAPLVKSHAVFVFDDWDSGGLAERQMGERRAFEEFLSQHAHFRAEELPGLNYKDKAGPRLFLVTRCCQALLGYVLSSLERLDCMPALGPLFA
jgi:hypothetical protein